MIEIFSLQVKLLGIKFKYNNEHCSVQPHLISMNYL